MATRAGLSKRSAGVRRLLQEAAELENDDSPDYTAAPLESDLFDWHFTIRGLSGSQFEGGIYHGRMILPAEYPFKPPEIYLLTPSGRFEVNRKICLSISSFHPETWQPSWGVRTALLALISFFESDPKGAVGSLNAPPDERKRLANASHHYKCSTCGYDAADCDSFASLRAPSPPAPSPSTTPGSDSLQKVEAPERTCESEPCSEAISRSSTPDPLDAQAAEVQAETSVASALFPPAPSPPQYPAATPPSSVTDAAASPAGPLHLARPSPIAQYVATPAATVPASSAPNSTPAAAPATSARQASAVPALPPGVSLAQADYGSGGPPSYIDRAILVVLLSIVALLVRKVA
ncbi:uncharacterized protein JCM15063_002158 [Sporobolomyces koalae]|uniref:uncharacterized protein n=1 Tax=Sporobolomyces koalae TaxID=500713 RepID=UPI003174A68E